MNDFPTDESLLKILKPDQKEIEDSFIERKRGFSKRNILKTIVAFANTISENRFAVIFVGVTNDGKIFNVNSMERKMQYVRILCNHICYPPIKNFKLRRLSIEEDTSILAIIIDENKEKPYFSGRSCIRQGSSNIDATEDQFNKLISFRNSILYDTSGLEKNERVLVVVKQRRLGKIRVEGPSFRDSRICYVKDFNQQFITFITEDTQQSFSEPVKKITLSRDDSHYRLKYIIEE